MATRPNRRWSRPAAEGALVLVALLLMLFAAAAGFVVGRETADDDGGGETVAAETTTGAAETAETETEPATTEETPTGDTGGETEGEGGEDADGEAVFASAGCGSCHTFEPAGASGNVGPSLDETDLSKDEIEEKVRQGGGGMPPFEGQLSDAEIEAVADFVDQG